MSPAFPLDMGIPLDQPALSAFDHSEEVLHWEKVEVLL